jgi:hypothetical protein
VELLHVTEPPQVPFAVQVCTPLPEAEHCAAPGAHTPWHAPLTHAWLVQAAAVPQVPMELHVCTPPVAHCVAPGTQTPWHAPPAHA